MNVSAAHKDGVETDAYLSVRNGSRCSRVVEACGNLERDGMEERLKKEVHQGERALRDWKGRVVVPLGELVVE